MNEIISKIKNLLEKNIYFNCELCFVRGSFAVNRQKANSDLDLLIISNDFCGISSWKRRDLVEKTVCEADAERRVDAICLSVEEYQRMHKEGREMLKNERMERII